MTIPINKNLFITKDYNPTNLSLTLTIKDICQRIDNNEICLPVFQTSMRWSMLDALKFFNYELNGKAPVSAISANLIEDENISVRQLSLINRHPIIKTKGCYSINDGQQRCKSNHAVYAGDSNYDCIVLDLIKGLFILKDKVLEPHQIPITSLYNKDSKKLYEYIRNNSELNTPDITDFLLDIRNKFMNYKFTINVGRDLSKDEQTDWFDILNRAGSPIPEVQITFSRFLEEGIDIYNDYVIPYRNLINSYGYESSIFQKRSAEVSIAIASLNSAYELITNSIHTNQFSHIASDEKSTSLCKLSVDELKKCFTLTLTNLVKALDFINDKKLLKPKRCEYITFILGLFVKLDGTPLTKTQEAALIDWFNSVNFKGLGNPQRRTIYSDVLKIKNI